jgi:hypothetical protein
MPAASKAQNRLFRAAAASPAVAKKTGLSQAAAKKLVAEQKGVPVKNLPQRVPKRPK